MTCNLNSPCIGIILALCPPDASDRENKMTKVSGRCRIGIPSCQHDEKVDRAGDCEKWAAG